MKREEDSVEEKEGMITCPKCKLQDPTHDVSIVQHRRPGVSLIGVGWRCIGCGHEWGNELPEDNMELEQAGFYYLHANGNLIFKPASVVNYDSDYFSSPFVRKVWRVNVKDRLCAWRIVLEALSMGCSIPRAKELSEKWGLTLDDSIEMLKRTPRNEVTAAMTEGMKIFIPEILGMEVERFWALTKEDWDGKTKKIEGG